MRKFLSVILSAIIAACVSLGVFAADSDVLIIPDGTELHVTPPVAGVDHSIGTGVILDTYDIEYTWSISDFAPDSYFDDDGKFVAGQLYQANVTVIPHEGYGFDYVHSDYFHVEGGGAHQISSQNDDGTVTVKAVFTAAAPETEAAVPTISPETGAAGIAVVGAIAVVAATVAVIIKKKK